MNPQRASSARDFLCRIWYLCWNLTQEDLRRAQIEPFAWVINQSLLNSGSTNPVLQRRERAEHRYIDEVCAQLNVRVVWMPWLAQEPVGVNALTQLTTPFANTRR